VSAHPSRGQSSLRPDDRAILDCILRNELDFAYRRRARRLLNFLDVLDGDRVLDFGCGMGFYLLALSRLRKAHLVGLEPNPKRLAWARRGKAPGAYVAGIGEQLPFGDSAFDKVLMSEVLEHLLCDRAGLREVRRVLRPGGVLAISVPHARYPFLWDPINRVWSRLGGAPIRQGPIVGIWTGHQRLYEPHALAKIVTEEGFHVEILEEATHFAFPLAHFLLYGVGKPLFERGWLPPTVRASADRLSEDRSKGTWWNPVPLATAVFAMIDRLNDSPLASGKHTFVNVLLKARKP